MRGPISSLGIVCVALLLSTMIKPCGYQLAELPQECTAQENLNFYSWEPKPELMIHGSICHFGDKLWAYFTFTNVGNIPMIDWSIQFGQNSFGFIPTGSVATGLSLMPNTSVSISIPVSTQGRILIPTNPPSLVQIIVTNSAGEFYFTTEVPLNILLSDDGKFESEDFFIKWDQLEGDEVKLHLNLTANVIQKKLEANKIFTIAQCNFSVGSYTYQMMYMSAKFVNNIWVLLKVKVEPGTWSLPPEIKIVLKTDATEIIPNNFVLQFIKNIIINY